MFQLAVASLPDGACELLFTTGATLSNLTAVPWLAFDVFAVCICSSAEKTYPNLANDLGVKGCAGMSICEESDDSLMTTMMREW